MQISSFRGYTALLRYSFKRQCGGGVLVTKSCLTHATPCSSVNGISQARILERVAFSSPGDLPNPGIKHTSPTLQAVSCIIGGFFTSESPGKPLTENTWIFKNNNLNRKFRILNNCTKYVIIFKKLRGKRPWLYIFGLYLLKYFWKGNTKCLWRELDG